MILLSPLLHSVRVYSCIVLCRLFPTPISVMKQILNKVLKSKQTLEGKAIKLCFQQDVVRMYSSIR